MNIRAALLSALLAPLLLFATAQAQIRVVVYPPVEVRPERTGTILQQVDTSGFPIWCTDISRRGRSPLPDLTARVAPSTGEIAVGVRRFHDPGTAPFPCPETWSVFLTGRVLFRPPHVVFVRATVPGVRLVSASLRFTEVDRQVSLRSAPLRCNSVVGAIGMIRRPEIFPWPAGLVAGDAGAGVVVARALPRTPGLRRVIDVTDIVQQWFDGSRPNLGLALIGVQDSVGDSNMVCAAFIRDIRLVVRLEPNCPVGTLRGGRRCFLLR